MTKSREGLDFVKLALIPAKKNVVLYFFVKEYAVLLRKKCCWEQALA